jgi:hypothetical protein
MKIHLKYFITFILLLIIEILIARYATGFLRHTIGDYLAVMFVYTFIKSFFKIAIEKAAIITLVISYIIEFLQLSNLQNWYPSEYTKTFKLILGTSFSVGDLVAYTLGIGTIILVEKSFKNDRNEKAI